MIKVSPYKVFKNISSTSDREYYLSEWASWLIMNIGERNRHWWWHRNTSNGWVEYIAFLYPEDALVFSLKFGL